MYDAEALKRGIEKAYKNIEMFEGLIEKERDTISEYKILIDNIEKKAKLSNNGSQD